MVSACTAVLAVLAAALALGVRHGLRVGPVDEVNGRNMFLTVGNFAPVRREVYAAATLLPDGIPTDSASETGVNVVSGAIPSDLRGAFIRCGSNQRVKPEVYMHWFDGDGMVHAVTMLDSNDTAGGLELAYNNHWVRTHRLLEDDRTGRAISPLIGSFVGLRGLFSFFRFAYHAITGQRNVTTHGQKSDAWGQGNTAVVYHDRRLMTLVESASPFQVRLQPDGHVQSVGLHTYDGKLDHPFTAHPKLDPVTGEMFIFGYKVIGGAPMSYGVVSREGDLVPLPDGTPVAVHDFAITEHYSIIFDVPFTARLYRPFGGGCAFQCEDRALRFGLLPRLAVNADQIRWFEAEPGHTFHTANAWEETAADGSTEVVIVLVWYAKGDMFMEFGFGKGPGMTDLPDRYAPRADHMDAKVLKGVLREFRLNLGTGAVRERTLPGSAAAFAEFPQVNPNYLGRKTRYTWTGKTVDDAALPGHVFGCMKVDLEDDGNILGSIVYGENKYGGEPVFVPRPDGEAEDDGYLLTFVHDEAADDQSASELWIMDAKTMSSEPLARVRTPQRVPYGFHGTFITQAQVFAQRMEGAAIEAALAEL